MFRILSILLPLLFLSSSLVRALASPLPPLHQYVVFFSNTSTSSDLNAAQFLASNIGAAVGGQGLPLPIVTSPQPDSPMIIVGASATLMVYPSLAQNLSSLGLEGYLVKALDFDGVPMNIVVSGSQSTARGTEYGAGQLLYELGFRFYTPTVNVTPSIPGSITQKLDVYSIPALEYRHSDNWQFDLSIPWSNVMRDNYLAFPYANPPGYVHTAYILIPPETYNSTHPEWFGGCQLCWTNTSLIAELVTIVTGILHSQPNAKIISVSQNDCTDYCQRPEEMKVINEEGSPQGPILRAVNTIAQSIEKEFPTVAISTLAYQYSRKPPNITVPRPNVIVQLCSIECEFAVPLSDNTSDLNVAFQQDLKGWANIMNRIYI